MLCLDAYYTHTTYMNCVMFGGFEKKQRHQVVIFEIAVLTFHLRGPATPRPPALVTELTFTSAHKPKDSVHLLHDSFKQASVHLNFTMGCQGGWIVHTGFLGSVVV